MSTALAPDDARATQRLEWTRNATAEPGVRANGSAICVNPTCGGSND